MPTINTYPYGAGVTHMMSIEVADEPADPTSLSVYQVTPLGVQIGPFTPTKVAKGEYEYTKIYSATAASLASTMWGNWDIMWKGTGNAEGTGIETIYIASSRFSI